MRKRNVNQTPAEVIFRRRSYLNLVLGYRDLLIRLVVIALAMLIVLSQVFMLTQAKGQDMFPSIKDGDLLFGYRLQGEYSKNDVVIYKDHNGNRCVGRIIARGSDVVTMGETGSLLVNGTSQAGEIIYPTYAKEGVEYPYVVPDGCVFILGDYRTQAVDSRDFGAVDLGDVEAKVITFARRRSI